MKTLKDFKDEVVKKEGFKNWKHLCDTIGGPIKELLNDEAAELYAEYREKESITGKYIPYQRCPICDGKGKVLADGFTSAVYAVCTVCQGAKVIAPLVIQDDYKQGWNEALQWASEQAEKRGFYTVQATNIKQEILKGLK